MFKPWGENTSALHRAQIELGKLAAIVQEQGCDGDWTKELHLYVEANRAVTLASEKVENERLEWLRGLAPEDRPPHLVPLLEAADGKPTLH